MNEEKKQEGFESISDIFSTKMPKKKAPAYRWQDLALKVINELNIPDFKRNSVFKACRDNSEQFILNCLNDTKELCQSGDKWKYFFKLTTTPKDDKKPNS